MSENYTILIVEDEIELAGTLEKYLQQEEFTTKVIHHGSEVEPWLQDNRVDLILLDRLLPGKDGIAICQSIRERSDIPIIMLTALQEEEDRLLGLEVGADDYICKPYSAREVVARIKTVLRRLCPCLEQQDDSDIVVDKTHEVLYIKGVDAELTSVEFRLFNLMYSHPEKIHSRQAIMKTVYDDHRIISERSIDSHVKNLRKKFDKFNLPGKSIKSVYGRGYRFLNL